MIRHGETGQFLSPRCQDPNCDGELVPGVSAGPFHEPVWACNGLVSIADYGPLVACERAFPRTDIAKRFGVSRATIQRGLKMDRESAEAKELDQLLKAQKRAARAGKGKDRDNAPDGKTEA